MLLIVYALPVVLTVWVLWLVVTPFLSWSVVRLGLPASCFFCVGRAFLCLRFDGLDGSLQGTMSLRWESEGRGQVPGRAGKHRDDEGAAVVKLQPGDWPGFRGPNRDNRLTGVRIATDWQKHPPRLLWKHRIGPGWSSFAVVGDWLYTQEQRGQEEMVVCYDAATGEQSWEHGDAVRFDEAVARPRPAGHADVPRGQPLHPWRQRHPQLPRRGDGRQDVVQRHPDRFRGKSRRSGASPRRRWWRRAW